MPHSVDKTVKNENFKIVKLKHENFEKCSNVWDLKENEEFTKKIYNDLKSGNRITFVYKSLKSGNFLGEISLVFNDEEIYTIKNVRVYLSRLIVKKSCRNKGIGTALCNYLFDFCKNLGYKEISLAVNLDNFQALKLYHKLGFNKILSVNKDEYGEYIVLLKNLFVDSKNN